MGSNPNTLIMMPRFLKWVILDFIKISCFMEIYVQMRAVNLYTLTRKIDNEIYEMYEMALSDRAEAIRIRMEEID